MNIDRLSTLLPCSNLADLRLDRDPEEAEELLSAWSALWHPALIDSVRAMPSWYPADQPPSEPAGSLIILPECCESLLPEGWLDAAKASGALVLRKFKHRSDMVSAALERLDLSAATIEPALAADFLALGFCRFIVELLTLKLRYASNINEETLRTAVLDAARATVQGNTDNARSKLQAAFDRLHEGREYCYPVEAHFIDLTLAASTTLGESLRKELAAGIPRNLLISGEVLKEMARREPDTLAVLKQALTNNSLTIVGGEFAELPLLLLTPDAIESHLHRGIEVYEHLLGRRPVVFGRRRFGLSLALPQILAKTGFTAAMHFTLDDGQFPTGSQSYIEWEGFGGTAIDALSRLPLDADRADSFFSLPEKLGNALELDHPATIVFAHWPGHVCPWYDDLARIFSYSKVLGAFCTLDDYFQQARLSGQRVRFNADQYRTPYFAQDVAANRADPISRWVRYYQRRAICEAAQTLHTFATLPLKNPISEVADETTSEKTTAGFAADIKNISASLENTLNSNAIADPDFDHLLQQTLDAALQRFRLSLIGDAGKQLAVSQCDGYLLANTCSFSQRLGVDLPGLDTPPEVADPIRAADEKAAVIDLPGMGFAWIGAATEKHSSPASGEKKGWLFGKRHKIPPPMAEENTLRNEFFEVTFDPHTGAIHAIRDYRSRHPRLAQQIALRMPPDGEQDPTSDAQYSIMSADEICITSPGPVLGEIVSSGKITDGEGRRIAGFRQTTRAWRGSRVLELEIELDIDRQPGPNPWNSYYACRFAWSDETSNLYRSVNLTTQSTELTHLESPHFIDIRNDPLRTTILCGGLPYHRRIGLRKLDTLLIAQGETARSFSLGVGIDLPNAMSAALGFLAPKTIYFPSASPPANYGWLFHLDHRNIIATHWEPIFKSPLPLGEGQGEGQRVQGSGFRVQESEFGIQNKNSIAASHRGAGQGEGVVGFCVRLLETEGHHTQLGLRSFRPVASAVKMEPGNTSPIKLPIEGDRINIHVGPYQSIDVEVLFALPAQVPVLNLK
jgi:alpha-mannosidase